MIIIIIEKVSNKQYFSAKGVKFDQNFRNRPEKITLYRECFDVCKNPESRKMIYISFTANL